MQAEYGVTFDDGVEFGAEVLERAMLQTLKTKNTVSTSDQRIVCLRVPHHFEVPIQSFLYEKKRKVSKEVLEALADRFMKDLYATMEAEKQYTPTIFIHQAPEFTILHSTTYLQARLGIFFELTNSWPLALQSGIRRVLEE
jgi:hypothetical protein